MLQFDKFHKVKEYHEQRNIYVQLLWEHLDDSWEHLLQAEIWHTKAVSYGVNTFFFQFLWMDFEMFVWVISKGFVWISKTRETKKKKQFGRQLWAL